MHELSLCQSAVEIIQRQAEQHDVKRVTAVWLEVARSPALRRAPSVLVLKLSATERWRKGAIYISSINPPVPGAGIAAVVEIHQHDAQCPLCHGERLRVDTGDSLIVKSIEVE